MSDLARPAALDEYASGADNWYGFEKVPFHVTPDSQMIYNHKRYEEAFSALSYGVGQGKGFIVITGEVGAGKTTLIRHFLSSIGESMRCAVVFNTGLGPQELLEAIADDLGIAREKIEGAGIKRMIDAVNEVLFEEFEKGRNVAVFIDESQNLSVEALEVLRMLSNLETESEKLMQIVLIGQPELQKLLSRNDLRQLKSRIAVTYHMMPMDLDETSQYIAHRIALAAPARVVAFDADAVKRIHGHAGGIPRIINILADQSLLIGASQQTAVITSEIVETVIAGFDHLESDVDGGGRNSWFRIAAVTLLTAALVFLFLNRTGGKRIDDLTSAVASRAMSGASTNAADAGAAAVSPLRKLLESHGITAADGVDAMRLEAVASSYNLALHRVSLAPQAAERLKLPALLMPGNPVLTNRTPAVVADIFNGAWKLETAENGTVTIDLRLNRIPLTYLVPRRPYMSRVLRFGMGGDDVMAMQKILRRAGLMEPEPNGNFGPATAAAVKKLQMNLKLNEDTVVGPETMLGLYSLEKPLTSERGNS